MGLTKKAQIKRAKALGEAVAEELFTSMQNPRYRGPNFKWEGYSDMAAQFARVQAFTAFPHQIGEDIETVAAEAARQKASELLNKTLNSETQSHDGKIQN